MNKSKFLLGIGITILGGSIMLIGMISGIFHFAGNSYADIKTFNLEPPSSQVSQKTSLFTVRGGQNLSVWLKFPDRQIENKDFKIEVSLVDENGNILENFGENFSVGFYRNSAGKGQYYKIGEHNFKNEIKAYLQYEISGTWFPAKESNLVLRQSLPFSLPIKQIIVFICGISVLLIGISTIAKNHKKKIH